MASDYDSVIVVNQGYEKRYSSSGKERVVIVCRSEPLAVNLDPKTLGRGPAQAIAHHFREAIKSISATAAPATLKARKVAAKAYASGKEWAVKRYSGGRMGAMPPNQSDKAFNDSGRFAAGIVASGSSDGAWRVNVAANRLDSSTSGGVERIFAKLVALVPEIGDPSLLLSNDFVKAAIAKSQKDMVQKMRATTRNTSIELAKAVFDLIETAVEAVG